MVQLQFINRLLETRDTSLITTNGLTDEYFSDYQEEFNYIKEHIDDYGSIPDKTTFLSKFPEFDVFQVNETNGYLLDKLYEDRNTLFLAKTFKEVRQLVSEGKADDAMKLFLTSADKASSTTHIECTDILHDTSRYQDYIDRINDFDKYYVRTGFIELDAMIGGWDRNEELVTIAARTNMGKSWVLLKCAVAALEQGLRVGIYSGEMTERKVGYRIDTLISHISNSGITKGDIGVQAKYKAYIDDLPNKFPNGCLKILTPKDIGGFAGVSTLRAFVEKEKLDILFVDQHSLLEDDRKAKNPVEKASNISKDLKNLQVAKHIPIITVSQQNRSSTENGVGTEHIAQSDRISQDSTIIIFFEQKDGVMTMHLVKSRDSVNSKTISYAVDLDKGVFNYIPEEGNGVDGAGVQELYNKYEDDGEVVSWN